MVIASLHILNCVSVCLAVAITLVFVLLLSTHKIADFGPLVLRVGPTWENIGSSCRYRGLF